MTRHGYIYAIYNDEIPVYTGKTFNMTDRWNKYRTDHQNTSPQNKRKYNHKIHVFMRKVGFDNCDMRLLETIEIEVDSDLNPHEGRWQSIMEKDFDLLNIRKAGNGDYDDKNSIAYQNKLIRMREQIECELCGQMSTRGNIRTHQRTAICKANRKPKIVINVKVRDTK
mgnify:CR=1 FL=1